VHYWALGGNLQQLLPGVPGAVRPARVSRVARVLTVVGAFGDEVADQIMEDFELALAARQAGPPGQRISVYSLRSSCTTLV
jgi:hypothetical protein